MKIDWKHKLTSRKFWLAVVGFTTALLIAFNVDGLTIEQVTGIITAGGILVAYILGESYVDGKHGSDEETTENTNTIGFRIDDEK